MNKIICIDATIYHNNCVMDNTFLTVGKVYDILEANCDKDDNERFYYIENDEGEVCGYYKDRFMSFKEYRLNKLKKIEQYESNL